MTNSISIYKFIGIKNLSKASPVFLTAILISIPGYDLPKVGEWFELISFDKLIHTGLFGMLSGVYVPGGKSTLSAKIKLWFIKVALATIIWGLTTELIQRYFIPRRSYDLVDFTADALGGIVAYIFLN